MSNNPLLNNSKKLDWIDGLESCDRIDTKKRFCYKIYMRSLISILIFVITLIDVTSFGYESIRENGISASIIQSEDNCASSSVENNQTCPEPCNNSESSALSHSCHLGHCSFVIPYKLFLAHNLLSSDYISSIEQLSSITPFLKKRPPKV